MPGLSKHVPRKSWRDDMKAKDPAKYEKTLAHSRIYSSLYRIEAYSSDQMATKRNLSAKERETIPKLLERKKRLNESANQRMRKMRQKRKLNEQEKGKEKAKPQTRQQRERHERQKQVWRDRKKVQRETMSKEEHERMLANRRGKYAVKKQREQVQFEEELRLKAEKEKLEQENKRLQELERQLNQKQEEIDKKKQELADQGKDVRSKEARRKSLQRARSGMPKKPSHYASTAMDLISQASPEKTKMLKTIRSTTKEERLKDTVMNVVSSELSQPSSSGKKALVSSLSGELGKEQLQREAARKFRVSRKLVRRAGRRKTGRKSLSLQTLTLVKEFYQSRSYTMPDKRYVSKRTGKPTSFLDRSLTSLYKQFNEAHPQVCISFSKFCQMRPRHIKTMGKTKLAGCLCEYCANLKLKLDTINTHLAMKQSPTVKDLYALSNSTLCEKGPSSKYNMPRCVQRECPDCGVDKIDTILKPFRDTEVQSVSWKRWELVVEEVKMKNSVKTVKKRALVIKTGTVEELITELKEELRPFSEHLFIKDFQAHQLQELRQNLPQGSAMSILDFAENYVCRYQDEAQSAYWTQQAATIHPFVTYYRCYCNSVVTESIVIVSDDLTHDHNAVHAFQKEVMDHLMSTRHLKLKKYIRFSDCCTNQYRSKGPFADISKAVEDFNIEFEHNFCGERHGKGASDGESAVLKSSASTAVKNRRAIIRNAKELYEYAKENLTIEPTVGKCTHFVRTILFVPSNNVDHNRDRNRECKTVPGTRKVHCIKTVKDGVAATRNLTCCCTACIDGKGTCINELFVHDWKEVSVCPAKASTTEHGSTSSHTSTADTETRESNTSSTTDGEPQPSGEEPQTTCGNELQPPGEGAGEPQTTGGEELQPPGEGAGEPQTTGGEELQPPGEEGAEEPQPPGEEGAEEQLEPPGGEARESQVVAEQSHPTYVKVGDFAAVIFDDIWWPGEVTNVLQDSCLINFMTRKGINRFIWPSQKDEAWISKLGIFRLMPGPPAPVSNRYLGFDPRFVTSITHDVKVYLNGN